MDLYLILDESGNLHKNSSVRYFVIGGYLTNNAHKARSEFKKKMDNYKKTKNLSSTMEIKGSSINDIEKINILSDVCVKLKKNNFFIPVLIVVDKHKLKKEIEKVNILYNYFIKLLIKRLKTLKRINKKDKLKIKLDNKTIKVGSINTLKEYLIAEFYFENFELSEVQYLDSKHKQEIQLADFICNHYWRLFEKKKKQRNRKKCKNIDILYFPVDNFGVNS